MRGAGVFDGEEADALVKAGGSWIFSAQTDGAEMLTRVVDEGRNQGAADPKIPPREANVDAAYTADGGVAGKGIEVEATNGDEDVVFDRAHEDFSGTVETILARRPVVEQCVNEAVACSASLCMKLVDARGGKGDGAHCRHAEIQDKAALN